MFITLLNTYSFVVVSITSVDAARKATGIHPKCQQRKDSDWVEGQPKQFIQRVQPQKKVERQQQDGKSVDRKRLAHSPLYSHHGCHRYISKAYTARKISSYSKLGSLLSAMTMRPCMLGCISV